MSKSNKLTASHSATNTTAQTQMADEKMKVRIQRLIDIYCTYVFGVDRDAGWHAPSQLEALISANITKTSAKMTKPITARVSAGSEHQSSSCPDDRMIKEIKYVRNKHYDFGLAKMLLDKLEDKQLLALLAGQYLKHVYKRVHENDEIAKYLEMTTRSYRHNKKRAEIIIEQHLKIIDQYELLKIA